MNLLKKYFFFIDFFFNLPFKFCKPYLKCIMNNTNDVNYANSLN